MRFLACFLSACAFSAAATAQPAPIEYAAQNGGRQLAAVSDALAGADETSYDYGATRARGDAVLDVRRERRDGADATPGARDWLEQERVGPPYEVNGRWYVPTPEPGYEQVGEGSWYGPGFHGQATASGETYDQHAMTAAHPTLPLQSLVQVTNLENGREVIVRINDRGPFVGERLIDLSRAAAEALGYAQTGRARVHVRYLGPAPRRVTAQSAGETREREQVAAAEPRPGPLSLLPRAEQEGARHTPVAERRADAFPVSDFVVQVGAFSDPANAQRVRAVVERAGPVEVDVRRNSGGTELFRVRLGPFSTAEQAETARRALAELGYPEAVVAAR